MTMAPLGTSMILSTNAMIPLSQKLPSNSANAGTPVDRGSAPSKKNMHEMTPTCARYESLLSIPQVATFLNVSRLTVYRLIERGLLPVYKIARRLRFRPNDVEAYLASARTHHDYANKED